MSDDIQIEEKSTNLTSFRSAYQEYSNYFGIFGAPVLNIPHRLEKDANSGYIVNKSITELINRITENGAITYVVYDHIRQIQETLTGLFTVDNDEFKYIFKDFLSEFIMDEVWIIYSEEVKLLEEVLLKKQTNLTEEDLLIRQQKAKFQSNFRLLKRVPLETAGTYGWKSVLTGVTGIKLTPEHEKIIKRVTFNEGFFFTRLFRIFSTYESNMQSYLRLFKILHTPIFIRGDNVNSINTKLSEILTANAHIPKPQSDFKHGLIVDSTKLHQDIDKLDLSYHVIQTQLNDSLARLGLGGDDSTKAERITTGENFRALQPNSSFQEAILHELNNVAYLLKLDGTKIDINFDITLKPNTQGIPINNDQSQRFSSSNKE